jgi:hypothetical protein
MLREGLVGRGSKGGFGGHRHVFIPTERPRLGVHLRRGRRADFGLGRGGRRRNIMNRGSWVRVRTNSGRF